MTGTMFAKWVAIAVLMYVSLHFLDPRCHFDAHVVVAEDGLSTLMSLISLSGICDYSKLTYSLHTVDLV